ncbi:MAG: hypothetical protein AAGE80_10345 [Pseudomonadota bacterium]
MIAYPLRLLFVSYGLAGLVALTAPGLSPMQILLVFWLGGAGLVFPLAILPGLRPVFTRGLVLSPHARSEHEEFVMWDEDIERETLVPAAKPTSTSHEAPKQGKRRTG